MFSTKYHDDETGLVYYGYRYYSPELGRWLNRDPLHELAFNEAYSRSLPLRQRTPFPSSKHDPGALNIYLFVLNNPVGAVDLLGLDHLICGYDTLVWMHDSGFPLRRYSAVSGPYGNGRLPSGWYDGRLLRDRSKPGFSCFGFGYSLNLDPRFNTTRTLLRIHPDGGQSGTLGCIGVTGPVCANARGLYNDLKRYLRSHSSIDTRRRGHGFDEI